MRNKLVRFNLVDNFLESLETHSTIKVHTKTSRIAHEHYNRVMKMFMSIKRSSLPKTEIA
jgi:hypothetical protein